MGNALIPCDVTLFYKNRTNDEGNKVVVKQEAQGWNVDATTVGIFIDPNTLYIVPLDELEGVLIEYKEAEEDGENSELTEGEFPQKTEDLDGERTEDPPVEGGKVYIPNFGGGSKAGTGDSPDGDVPASG